MATPGLVVVTDANSSIASISTATRRIRQQLCDGAAAGTPMDLPWTNGVIGALMFTAGALPVDVTDDVIVDKATQAVYLATIDSTGSKVWITYF